MKTSKIILSLLAAASFYTASAGDLISITPNDGLGVRAVRVWNDTGNPDEKGTNVLLDKTISENVSKKWCTANNDGDNTIEIMFELSDYYDIDKVIIYDCKTQEDDANMTYYEIWTATSATGLNTDQGDWVMADSKSGQGDVDIKTSEFTPVKARYVKLTSKNVHLIRVYAIEIYGTKSSESAHPDNLISVGKPVLKYYDSVNLLESPFGLFDGNKTNAESKWCFARALDTDPLKFVVVDLLDIYKISEVKLYDCRLLEADQDNNNKNILGYNFYVSETMPNLDLISATGDANTCWEQAVTFESGTTDRSAENIKEDVFSADNPVYGRYIKLEVPLDATPETNVLRLFELEIYGELKGINNSINETPEKQNSFMSSNVVMSGQNVTIIGNGIVNIYSLQGVNVKNNISCNGETVISTNALIPGCYIVKLFSESDEKTQKLVVK